MLLYLSCFHFQWWQGCCVQPCYSFIQASLSTICITRPWHPSSGNCKVNKHFKRSKGKLSDTFPWQRSLKSICSSVSLQEGRALRRLHLITITTTVKKKKISLSGAHWNLKAHSIRIRWLGSKTGGDGSGWCVQKRTITYAGPVLWMNTGSPKDLKIPGPTHPVWKQEVPLPCHHMTPPSM